MVKRGLLKSVLVILFLHVGVVSAGIMPVVIETQFKLAGWHPLPEDKIKTAAVDSALSEISKTRRYAFFNSPPEAMRTGKLSIKINLVEAAQTATVSIMLQQPGAETISGIHSESLKNQSYDGIYKKFQLAGRKAGEKIALIVSSNNPHVDNKNHNNSEDKKRVAYLEQQILTINNKIIQQGDASSSIRNEAKLEFVLQELASVNKQYEKLAKQEDLKKQGVKIDKVLVNLDSLSKKIDETPGTRINVKQSYILENPLSGQTRIDKAKKAGADDDEAQLFYGQAQNLKRGQRFDQARVKLQQGIALDISPELRSLLFDELNYALPMFEAQAYTLDLGRNFQAYLSTGKDKVLLKKISTIYKQTLKNNRNDFQRTRKIQQLLDQQQATKSSMGAVVSQQNKMNAYQIKQLMQMQLAMRGAYPDKGDFLKMMKQRGIRFQVLKYSTKDYAYNAKLKSPDGGEYLIEADENSFSVIEKE